MLVDVAVVVLFLEGHDRRQYEMYRLLVVFIHCL